MSVLSLTKDDLLYLWGNGAIDEKSFIVLALKFDFATSWKSRTNLSLDDADLEAFKYRWIGQDIRGKDKVIKKKSILDSLEKLAKAYESQMIFSQLEIPDMGKFIGRNNIVNLELAS